MSKGLEALNHIGGCYVDVEETDLLLSDTYGKDYDIIEKELKENELLKEIIKSLFDRGCPLHQYTDYELGLTIEVDRRCSIMTLGTFKGVDLNKKLKEVLSDE